MLQSSVMVGSMNHTKRQHPVRVASSRPVEVEISDLTMSDVVNAASSPENHGDVTTGKPVDEVSESIRRTEWLARPTLHGDSKTDDRPSAIETGTAPDASPAGRNDGVIATDGDATVRIVSWKPLSALGWSCFHGLAWGIVWMLFLMLVSFALDKVGVLSMLNSLMGAAMHFDLGRMMMLSVVAGAVIGLFVAFVDFLNMMLLNSYSNLIGPLKAKVTVTWRDAVDGTANGDDGSREPGR